MTKLNASIGRTYKKNRHEPWSWTKFKNGMFGLRDSEGWGKDITSLFNIRKIIIFAIILTCVAGYFYWQGRQGKPVKVNLGFEEAVEIQVPHSDLRLYKPKNSQDLYWIDEKGNKTHVKLADIPSLRKALRPYGVIFEPYATTGVGTGEKGIDMEAGGGFYFFKFYLTRLGLHLTNKGIYAGVGYKLSGLGLNNTALNVSYGRGYSGDERIYFGITINF